MTTENKSSVKEDDLDELDDVLDQFDPKSPPPTRNPTLQPPTPASPSPLPVSSGRPRTNTRVDQLPKPTPGGGSLDATAEEDEITKAFTQELEKEMENLVKEFTQNMTPNPDKGSDSKNDSEESSKILKAAWEAMLVEGMDGLNAPTPDPASKPDSDKQAASSTNFQEKIQQTMEKLKQNDGGKASGSSSGNESDDIQKLLEAAMSGLGSEGGEGESEAELASFLENMMGQLMSKQVLYEPLKDLEEKFPPYLANPPSPISDQDRTRYDKQLVCIKKILAVFDKPDYDDKNASSSQAIVDLMSEMQSYGSPPSEVMGELPPGLGLGGEGMPEGCIIS